MCFNQRRNEGGCFRAGETTKPEAVRRTAVAVIGKRPTGIVAYGDDSDDETREAFEGHRFDTLIHLQNDRTLLPTRTRAVAIRHRTLTAISRAMRTSRRCRTSLLVAKNTHKCVIGCVVFC